MIKINLKDVLSYNKKTVYWLAKQTGISQNNLANLIKNETNSINFDNLSKICLALNCSPNDIIKVFPDK